MGIIQLPQMILVDDKGQVVNTNVQTAELAAELKKLIAVGSGDREVMRGADSSVLSGRPARVDSRRTCNRL